ncbi:MAG: DUF1080 domain-containing protein [Clostridia bacterium]|nr:DUF1080 domain-containing protein [Clostridia bacterium]
MNFLKNKTKIVLSVLFVFVIIVSASFIGSAENVVILEEKDPELTFVKIHGLSEHATNIWKDIEGEFTQDGSKTTMTSNGYAQWYELDSLHFAYKKVIFNYGKVATLTAETRLTSWNGKHSCAGAGLMIRSGTGPEAATVMVHCRPEYIMITYRSADTMMSIKGNEINTKPNYPVDFKISLNKTKVECFYKQASDKTYIKLGSVPFTYGSSVYIGQSAYSQAENDIAKATFDGFSYQVEAPEGTEVSKDETTSSPEDSGTEEDQLVLPADPPVADDVLLSETFTDGSLFDGEESVTNPIWTTDSNFPEVITTEDNTNRYLYEYMSDSHYLVGDEHWTDYETSLDLTFTDDSAPNEANLVDIYTRLTSIGQYGYHAYVVRFTQTIANEIPYRTIQLGVMEGEARIKTTSTITVKDEYSGGEEDTDLNNDGVVGFDYLGNLNEPLHLTIRTFDNKVVVYLNGTEILSYTDESNYIKAMGRIGFSTHNAAAQFDNIKVVKLDDFLGGDYDNKVSDLWEQQTPAYIQEYIDKGYAY